MGNTAFERIVTVVFLTPAAIAKTDAHIDRWLDRMGED